MFGILTSLQLVLLRDPHVMDQHKKHQQWQVARDRLVGAVMQDAAGMVRSSPRAGHHLQVYSTGT